MLWRLQGELLHDYDRKLNWFKIMKKTKTSKTVILALKDLLPPNYETNLSYWKKFHPVPKVLLTFTRFPSIWILVGMYFDGACRELAIGSSTKSLNKVFRKFDHGCVLNVSIFLHQKCCHGGASPNSLKLNGSGSKVILKSR